MATIIEQRKRIMKVAATRPQQYCCWSRFRRRSSRRSQASQWTWPTLDGPGPGPGPGVRVDEVVADGVGATSRPSPRVRSGVSWVMVVAEKEEEASRDEGGVGS